MPGNLSEGTAARQAQGGNLCVGMSAWASLHGKLSLGINGKAPPGNLCLGCLCVGCLWVGVDERESLRDILNNCSRATGDSGAAGLFIGASEMVAPEPLELGT